MQLGWMDAVKNFFGVILLAMAIWILNRLIPGHIILFLWGCLLIVSSMYLGIFNGADKKSYYINLRRGFGIIMYSICLDRRRISHINKADRQPEKFDIPNMGCAYHMDLRY